MEEGKQFSLLYLDRSKTLRDSQRFRNRLAAFFSQFLNDDFNDEIAQIIKLEIGAEITRSISSYLVSDFFKKGELRDLLDSITVIYNNLITMPGGPATQWKAFVAKAMSEENMGYRLDDKCIVHYFVDEEFERNRFSALAVLEDPRYAGCRAAFEAAYGHLDANPLDTKAAVRSMFESVEILVKQMVDTRNLSKWVVENTLKEKCLACYASDATAKIVMAKMFDGFAQWVESIHNYRHGQADTDPVVPPVNIAIYTLSSGTAFLRWLIELNTEQ